MELAYLNRLRLEDLLNTEKYTPMGGSSEQRPQHVEMRAVFELLPIRLGWWTDADLLLDGLNELPAGQRDIKYPQVRRLIEQHPALLAVVSCRELDYTDDLGFHRINITPLDPIRIREFAGRYLGVEQGEALFWRLAGGNDVRTTWEAWQRAGASFELFWSAPDIPQENPNVYSATSAKQDR